MSGLFSNPANWEIVDTLQGQEGGFDLNPFDQFASYDYGPNLSGTGVYSPISATPKTTTSSTSTAASSPTMSALSGATSPTGTTTTSPTGTTTGGGTATLDGGGDGGLVSNALNQIQTRIGIANELFGTLFGKLDKVIGEKGKALETQYGTTQERALRQAGVEGRGINRAFGARGLGSSDFRTDALGELGQGLTDVLSDERGAVNQQKGALGETKAVQEATWNTQKNQLNQLLAAAQQTTDQYQLQQILDNINSVVGDLQISQAGLQPEGAFVNQVNELAPVSAERIQRVTDNLSVIAQGLLPSELKQQAARRIIGQSNLSPEEQESLYAQFQSQLAG